MRRRIIIALVGAISISAFASTGKGADGILNAIHFHENHFEPLSLTVPSGQPLTIKVANDSKETIEFESFKLNREKAIEPGETISVKLPALSPGSYDFYDDFHQDVPQGTIVAK